VDILRRRITDGEYPPNSRLPSESDLASEFDLSRGTIRGALAHLAAEGLIRRRHGSGTYVAPVIRVANPLNEVVDYRELIERSGFSFGFQPIGAQVTVADEPLREALALNPGALVLQVTKAFTADDELLVYTINTIPEWVFRDHLDFEEVTQPGATEPLWDFFAQRCRQEIDDFFATVRPEIAANIPVEPQVAVVDPQLPVLVIEEVGYNSDGRAILHEIEYLFGHRMRFELARRRRRASAP
jgi:GntR family transcriptional regulator